MLSDIAEMKNDIKHLKAGALKIRTQLAAIQQPDGPSGIEMAGHDDCTERGEAKQDKTEDRVDESKEDRADAVGNEANGDDRRGEPGREAGGGHQESPGGGAVAHTP